ncbi:MULTISPECIES: efflux RND transporter permease subunit [Hydrocarboniphaga]|uniref:CzcA family heavy metal efflux pump n=1 Tax=Hydrocarboniphaga effusa AP103 TaxID=1172194 RepID=I8T259_9GAMM|nr:MULTISPECIES: efflux RND transporter permease subunit [Hydrocarboniphaga]EIT67768.1 CzcA family heavy metal efflux pump [Hydrocarboniphaga effusa AP103]MDZ4079817.1 efflux RND transporter permease subunit [Hydrocarboniphaga sp.]
MIARLIHWSVHNRFLVLLATLLVTAWGLYSAARTPLDAIPDLSDTQVIVRTVYPGQAPQVVEDQVTYPLTTTLLSVPHAKTVRGYSLFGESFVYVLFEDGVDLYWARSRVLEYLSQVQGRLPVTARAALGPDATGVGWIYEYALVDRTGKNDISQLRALQDWFLKYELKTVPNVAEVATIGGFNRQYQIVLDPDRLRAYRLPLDTVIAAVQAANGESGGSVLELAETEYMVRARGYLKSLDDFREIPVGLGDNGTPILLRDVAAVQIGPETRRGIAELDGEGEVVGGVIVLRSGENAQSTIEAVKAKLETLKASLPEGVEVVETYDRSALIDRAVENLSHKLLEEFLVVALVCALFLWHLRSALVAIITLPIGILAAFIVMHAQGINANIMSLGGIAIAVGAMVDAAVVMIENAHKKLEQWRHAHEGRDPAGAERLELMAAAAGEVGPALFFSLLIITLSFVPVFTLEAQEGRLFAPLAYTKTYAMAAAAALSVTLIPVLMVAFIRGRILDETANPLNRALIAVYRPVIDKVLAYPRATLVIALLAALATLWPATRLGSEFMPPLDEGDLLYMPTALPGLAVGKAAEVLQQTDRILKTFPEVQRVFGKIGRAESATDPAPLEMVETTVRLKPRSEWRDGMTTEKLIEEMDAALKIPGMGNLWVQPIRNRIDMLATGIKSPVGIKIAGPDLAVIERVGAQIETVLKQVPGTVSAFSERVSGGRYIEVVPDRLAAARYGMSIADVQRFVSLAIGGENIGETVEGLQRFPINLRYPRALRDSVQDLRDLPLVTMRGETITLGSLATVQITDGPPMIKSENARPNGWIYVDIRGRDLGGYVAEARKAVAEQVQLPAGYSVAWSGQFEYLERATKRLQVVVPFTLAIIFLLLYLTFRSAASATLIMATLPFALVGGFWLIYLLGHHLSVASGVGFIALAGVSAEFGVVMLIYLDNAIGERQERGQMRTQADLREALIEGAVLRVRPKAMTVAVIVAGLVPLFIGAGAGSEVMQRIAAPMVGGMITAPLLSMIVLPAAYLLIRGHRLPTEGRR